ncbi:hypothetical protein HWV62_5622 [Athelia sp. TMB]|nr:hypothetical protein HWV62_5622 [Athelia sp. TMB]
MPLFPGNANWQDYVTNYENSEGMVNGWWTGLLQRYYPVQALANSISPEYNVGAGFTDLLVTSNVYPGGGVAPLRTIQVVYEGKDSNGLNLFNTFGQVRGYVLALSQGHPQNSTCFMIAARGRAVMFWKFVKGHLYQFQQMYINRGAVSYRAFDGFLIGDVFDLINDEANVEMILGVIGGNRGNMVL